MFLKDSETLNHQRLSAVETVSAVVASVRRVYSYPCLEAFLDKNKVGVNESKTLCVHPGEIKCIHATWAGRVPDHSGWFTST